MADDRATVYVLHRAVKVFDRPAVTGTKGAGFPDLPVRNKVSPAEFVVREADEQEATESAKSLRAAVDERVEQLRFEAAVRARMQELRREGWRP